MDYYKKKLYIAQVDKNDNVIGKVERWEAHKKGILHRGFTVCLFYKGQAILQHRKHPVFDAVYDLTCSSHPVFKGAKLQSTDEAVIETLKREWNIMLHVSRFKLHGKTYYNSSDPNSQFKEHEICYFYTGEVSTLPSPNFDFAYGFSLIPINLVTNYKLPITHSFAPWVKDCLKLL